MSQSNLFQSSVQVNNQSYIETQLGAAMDRLSLSYKTQHEIDNFQCDFVFPDHKLIVECDGFDYHSSKEQLTKDRKRDRKLDRLGWKVMRFTGSEIYADSDICALEVQDRLRRIQRAQKKIAREVVTQLQRNGYDADCWITPDGPYLRISEERQ